MSDVHYMLYNELKHFIEYVCEKKGWNLSLENYLGTIQTKSETRCAGRVWDANKWDINKQCKNRAMTDMLCLSCWNRSSNTGLVYEYPDENKVLIYYRKGLENQKKKLQRESSIEYNKIKDRDIDKEINLKSYSKILSKKKTHKKISNKINRYKMFSNTASKEEYTICAETSTNSIHRKISPTNIYDDWWNSELIDKIKIHDNDNGTNRIFALEDTGTNKYILNKNQVVMGEYRIWLDNDDTIVECYKNNNNQVLDPITAAPIFEYELYIDASMYHDLTPKIYRDYRYDGDKQELYFTNSIEIL